MLRFQLQQFLFPIAVAIMQKCGGKSQSTVSTFCSVARGACMGFLSYGSKLVVGLCLLLSAEECVVVAVVAAAVFPTIVAAITILFVLFILQASQKVKEGANRALPKTRTSVVTPIYCPAGTIAFGFIYTRFLNSLFTSSSPK